MTRLRHLIWPLLLLAVPATAQPAPSGHTNTAAETARIEAAFKALPEPEQKARLAASARLADASDLKAQLSQSIIATTDLIMPIFLQGNEGSRDDVVAIVNTEFLAEIERLMPVLIEQSVRRHAEVFSSGELDGLAQFYQSPVGKRLLAEMPALQARLMEDGGHVGQVAMQAALPRILARLKAANLNSPSTS